MRASGSLLEEELQSFEVPQLLTLIDGPKGDNQICVGYKNEFDLINEKNGDTLQLYQVDSSKILRNSLPKVASNQVWILPASHRISLENDGDASDAIGHISHFQKLREDDSHEFDFSWNSEPEAIAHDPDAEFKCDIFFISTAPDMTLMSPTYPTKPTHGELSPPPSPSIGQITSDKGMPSSAQPQVQPHSMLSPLVNSDEMKLPKSPTAYKRSPLLRTKRLGPLSYLPTEDACSRHNSNSSTSTSDSGFHTGRSSPPISPFNFSLSTDDDSAIV
ncbi:hypothetical protein LSH36_704g00019 [Paralvinella palmiformis]|uniref:Uncharacterized protein n=1 Tax=Paralvinella palmiformis TaxID=53620 RepID=A0AAD9MV81_9ANNE|nr:hypothetical protein LSH36_704g00019 [Paralvinella palmiformis]